MKKSLLLLLMALTVSFGVFAKNNRHNNSHNNHTDNNRPAYGYSQSAPPPAPAPMFRPVDDATFSRLLKIVKQQNFDRDRLLTIEAYGMLGRFDSRQVAKLLRVFSFDDNRLTALAYLTPAWTNDRDIRTILDAFSFNSSRDKALRILSRR